MNLKGIAKIPELEINGEPPSSVISFRWRKGINVNIFQIAAAMKTRHWAINKLQNRHVCIFV
eukprot:UN21694